MIGDCSSKLWPIVSCKLVAKTWDFEIYFWYQKCLAFVLVALAENFLQSDWLAKGSGISA